MRVAPVLALCALMAAAAKADDWPQWRGVHRDGAWEERDVLRAFPPGGLKPLWRAPVGYGFASPVIARGRVYLADAQLEKPRAHERVLCFEETTGKPLWDHAYSVDYPDWAFVPGQGGGPSATPIVESGIVYALGASGSVHCLDASTGRVVWEMDLAKEHQIAVLSCRASPLIEGDLLIVFTGGKPGASVVALAKGSGKEVWKALDDPVSNSSPLVISAGGKKQLIVWTGESVTSLDPATGAVYWREHVVTDNNNAVASPVIHEDKLFVAGLMMRLSADRPAASVLWPETRAVSRRVLSNTSTAMFRGDYLYSARTSGELACLEVGTGKQVWETDKVTPTKSGPSIHLTPNGDTVFLLTDRGELIHARLAPGGYEEISRAPLIEPTTPFMGQKMAWSPASFANRRVYARNDREVVCASLGDER